MMGAFPCNIFIPIIMPGSGVSPGRAGIAAASDGKSTLMQTRWNDTSPAAAHLVNG
jgi:hypothetical protein